MPFTGLSYFLKDISNYKNHYNVFVSVHFQFVSLIIKILHDQYQFT